MKEKNTRASHPHARTRAAQEKKSQLSHGRASIFHRIRNTFNLVGRAIVPNERYFYHF